MKSTAQATGELRGECAVFETQLWPFKVAVICSLRARNRRLLTSALRGSNLVQMYCQIPQEYAVLSSADSVVRGAATGCWLRPEPQVHRLLSSVPTAGRYTACLSAHTTFTLLSTGQCTAPRHVFQLGCSASNRPMRLLGSITNTHGFHYLSRLSSPSERHSPARAARRRHVDRNGWQPTLTLLGSPSTRPVSCLTVKTDSKGSDLAVQVWDGPGWAGRSVRRRDLNRSREMVSPSLSPGLQGLRAAPVSWKRSSNTSMFWSSLGERGGLCNKQKKAQMLSLGESPSRMTSRALRVRYYPDLQDMNGQGREL
ncbi:hypothetical protein OH76DRAFT_145098 [Lentinus brumalis]|uniref:Uncharacterized protein n=1 Tax=Lentinus brumalis TaxID=2498619 RepID=A0A371CPA4_9APHY|nr:hypothetical protein OH76DRAFT_145098 [Polyporus brumalis]